VSLVKVLVGRKRVSFV